MDFSKAKFHDRRWYMKLRCILQQLENELDLQDAHQMDEIYRLMFLHSLLHGDGTARDKTMNSLLDSRQRVLKLLKPWAEIDDNQVQDQEALLVAEYKQVFGDPNDPAYQQQLRLMSEEFRERRRQTREEQENKLKGFEKRVRERNEKLRQQRKR